MTFGFLVICLGVSPWSYCQFTLFAGPGVLFVTWLNSRPSGGSQIGFFKKKKVQLHAWQLILSTAMYKDSSVQDEFRYSVFIACHVIKDLMFNTFQSF